MFERETDRHTGRKREIMLLMFRFIDRKARRMRRNTVCMCVWRGQIILFCYC